MKKPTKITLNALCLGLLALFLWWAQGTLDGYKIQVLTLIGVTAILAVGLNLWYGCPGMFSLAHAGFMAIGAYVTAILILPAAQKEMMYILEPMIWPFSVMHAPFFFAVIAGGLVAALVGLFMALPCLKLGGDYLGIATLGFGEIIRVLFTNMTPITNGALGLKGIPAYANLGWNYFWCVLTFYVIVKLLSSNFGNTLRAVRDDEVAAKAMGINTFRTKTSSFVVGAFFAGVGGALMGSLITTIDPKMFNFQLTFNILMFVVVGGLGSITGSLIGTVVITVLLEWLRYVEDSNTIFSWEYAGIQGMRMLIYSLLQLFIILYRREGIIGGYEFSWDGVARFAKRLSKGKGERANG